MEKPRILIVDDEERILDAFSQLLEDLGYYVRTASRPEQALSLASADAFHIAFVDQFLGQVRGLDLMERMSEVNRDIYYVVITANGSTELAVESMKRGAADFISKPFFLADLVKSIDYVNKKRELDRQRAGLLEVLETKLEEKAEELRGIYFPVLSTLAQAMEKRDIGTYGHSMRVRHYSCLIASSIGLGEEETESLKAAAMLHDIGKIGTSDFILGKPGALTEEEMRIVRSHPKKGVEILRPLLSAFKQLEAILPAILHHHESYDGSGYPAGLAGEDIPLLARIISVADAYDAILSDRPYRAAAKRARAIEELSLNAARQFDPGIVAAFVGAHANNPQLFASY